MSVGTAKPVFYSFSENVLSSQYRQREKKRKKKSLVLLQKELSGPARILMAISSPRLDKPYLIYGLPKIGISMNNPGFRRFLSPFVL